MRVPRILLLSTTTGYQLRSFDEAAAKLGVEIVFATDRCHTLDDPWRDRAIAVRFHDEDASLDAVQVEAERSPFAAVLAVGDRPTVLAARVAEALGLRGNPPHAAAASRNKCESRVRFARRGLDVPWHIVLPTAAGGRTAASDRRVRFPCVLKPLGLSGSRGVIRADTPAALASAFDRIRALLDRGEVRAARAGLEDAILIEGFIPGREFAVEGVLTDGRLQVFAIFDKPDPLDGPFFEETIYTTPTALDTDAKARVTHVVAEGARALGLTHGPIHAECRVDEPRVTMLEIAPRPIGGLCSKALRFEHVVPLEEVLLRHALGEDVSQWRQDSAGSAVMMIPIPAAGLLKRVDGETEARAVPGVSDVRITAKIDQRLEPLPEAGSYLGFIFAEAADAREAERRVRQAHTALRFEIERAIAVKQA